ncbi:hypothetical protein Q9966_011773 [Columba livia]|nr:hypothetical protein Q9966_011773 [Columba livia]KAK2524166.1 hypothetical protein Q9966_011773 [Columba livia]
MSGLSLRYSSLSLFWKIHVCKWKTDVCLDNYQLILIHNLHQATIWWQEIALDPLKPLSDPFGRVQIFRDGYSLCRFGRSGEEDNWIKKNKTSAPTSRKAEQCMQLVE